MQIGFKHAQKSLKYYTLLYRTISITDLWKRDFTGSAGLFTFELKTCSEQDVLKFLDAFELFGLGFSYGGYESLVMNCDPQLTYRSNKDSKFQGPLIRLSIGLEDVDDLKRDLETAFATLPQ